MNKLREEYTNLQTSHDDKRHALDIRLIEIDSLRKALAERTDAIQAMEAVQARLAAGGSEREREQDRIVASLEADLARLRRNAEGLGHDLKSERRRREEEERRRERERREEKDRAGAAQKEVEEAKQAIDKAERVRKQVGAELKILKERIGMLEGERRRWDGHVCAAYAIRLVFPLFPLLISA